jgi:hypothetical protein
MSNGNFSALRYTISGWLMILTHLSAFIVIPILAYKFNNWWFLFGIAFLYIGIALGWKRGGIKIIIIAIVGVLLSIYHLFIQPISCYFLCLVVGFIVINLYRVIGLGDKTSRALIATTNPNVRQEISDEIEKGMNEFRYKKNSN